MSKTKIDFRATIMITHRLGLARLCSKIIVLHEGKIKEVGTHEELLSKSEYYKKLWDSQAMIYMGGTS